MRIFTSYLSPSHKAQCMIGAALVSIGSIGAAAANDHRSANMKDPGRLYEHRSAVTADPPADRAGSFGLNHRDRSRDESPRPEGRANFTD
jgi:hypothetical protein